MVPALRRHLLVGFLESSFPRMWLSTGSTARIGVTSPMPHAVFEKKHSDCLQTVFTSQALWLLSLVGWFKAAN